MNFGLTDEQEMIVSTVRSFVENEIHPHEDLVERNISGQALAVDGHTENPDPKV